MSFLNPKGNRFKAAIILIAVLGVSWIILTGGYLPIKNSITNSYEGPHEDLYAFQPANQSAVFAANDPNPCSGQGNCPFVQSVTSSGAITNGYRWNYAPTSTSITKVLTVGGTTILITTNLVPHIDPVSGTNFVKPINYKVPYNGGNNTVVVNGGIYLYDAQVNIKVQPGSSLSGNNAAHFQGDQLWLRLWSNTFNRYYPLSGGTSLPNGTQIGAWSAPIAMSLISGQELTQAPGPTNDATAPDWHLVNQPVSFFNTPQTSSSIGLSPQSANQTLAGSNPLAPDSRLTQYVYFPITLSNFGAFGYNCFITCTEGDPIVQFNFQAYFIQIGQYLFTNPFGKGIACGAQGCGGTNACAGFSCVSQFFTQNALWLALVGLLGGTVAIFLILAVFATPLLVAIVYYLASRKKGGNL